MLLQRAPLNRRTIVPILNKNEDSLDYFYYLDKIVELVSDYRTLAKDYQ